MPPHSPVVTLAGRSLIAERGGAARLGRRPHHASLERLHLNHDIGTVCSHEIVGPLGRTKVRVVIEDRVPTLLDVPLAQLLAPDRRTAILLRPTLRERSSRADLGSRPKARPDAVDHGRRPSTHASNPGATGARTGQILNGVWPAFPQVRRHLMLRPKAHEP